MDPVEIGAPLWFEPDSDAAFDEIVAPITRASQMESDRTGFKLDVTLVVEPEGDELSDPDGPTARQAVCGDLDFDVHAVFGS